MVKEPEEDRVNTFLEKCSVERVLLLTNKLRRRHVTETNTTTWPLEADDGYSLTNINFQFKVNKLYFYYHNYSDM